MSVNRIDPRLDPRLSFKATRLISHSLTCKTRYIWSFITTIHKQQGTQYQPVAPTSTATPFGLAGDDLNMPLELKPASPLPPFTFSPEPPSPPTDDPPPPPRPPADLIPARDMNMFGSHPLMSREEGKGLVRCNRCGRVNLESAVAEHKRE